MSDGLRDALGWLKPNENLETSGDGENGAHIRPDDIRWGHICWDDADEEIFVNGFDEPTEPNGKIKVPEHKPWWMKKCECGSESTSNPNLHARYCPKFTDPMGGH